MQCFTMLDAHHYLGFALLVKKYLQYMCQKTLFSTYTLLLKINKKKTNSPIEKLAKHVNSQFTEENTDKNMLNLSII